MAESPDRFGSKTARSSIEPAQNGAVDRIVLAPVSEESGSGRSSPPPVDGGFVKAEDKLRTVTVVIVAFRVEEENSVAYKKLRIPDDAKLGATINKMIHEAKADFISIRATEAHHA